MWISFDRISNCARHLERVNKCIPNSAINIEKKHICPYCKKEFTRNSGKTKHLLICEEKILKESTKEIEIENKPVITLHSLIKIDIEHIPQKEIVQILELDGNPLENLIKFINLNPDKPQFHNILYANLKSSYCDVYEGRWIKRGLNSAVVDLINRKCCGLYYFQLERTLFFDIKKKICHDIKWVINYYINYSKKEKNDLMRNVKALIYTDRNIIKKTKILTMNQIENSIENNQQNEKIKQTENKQQPKQYNKIDYDEITNENKKWLENQINTMIEVLITHQMNGYNIENLLRKMNNLFDRNNRKKIEDLINDFDYNKRFVEMELRNILKPFIHDIICEIITTEILTDEQLRNIFTEINSEIIV